MSKREGLLRALENASKAADAGDESAANDARQLAGMLKSMQASGSQAPEYERGAFDRFARGFGSSFADVLGNVPGAFMEAGNLTGLTDFEDTSGANLLRRQLEPVGLTNAPGQEAEGVAGMMGQGTAIGGTMGASLMGLGARTASRIGTLGTANVNALPSTAQRVLAAAGEPALSRPATIGMAEFAAGGAAGGAGEAARDSYGDDSWQAVLAELGAGITAAGAVSSGTRAAGAVGRGGLDLFNNTLPGHLTAAGARGLGFKNAGKGVATPRAQARVNDVATNPERARMTLEGKVGEAVERDLLTPTQLADDAGVYRLGAAVRGGDENSNLRAAWREDAERTTSELIKRIDKTISGDDADPEAAVRQLTALRDDATQQADNVVIAAGTDARQAIEALGTDVDPADAARILRDRLEFAQDESRKVVGAAWKGIPPESPSGIASFENAFTRMADEYGADEMKLLPASVRRFMNVAEEVPAVPGRKDIRGNFRPTNAADETAEPIARESTFGELQAMRSELLRAARTERSGASPNLNRARINTELADAITDDFVGAGSRLAPEVQDAFNAARALTAQQSQRFRQGSVGRVLGTVANGGDKVAPEMTIRAMVGTGARELRGVGTRELQAAVDNDPAAWGSVDDYMRHQFNDKVFAKGEVNLPAAETFMRQNAGVLQARPELAGQMRQAVDAQQRLNTAQSSASALAKSLNDPAVNRSDIFLRAANAGSIDEAVGKVLNGSNQAVRDTMRDLSTDPTGEAVKGFRKAVTDQIVGGATVRQSVPNDSAPERYLRGSRLREIFSPDGSVDGVPADILRMRRAVAQIYTPEQLANMRRYANTAYRLEQDVAAQGDPLKNVMTDATSKMLQATASIGGANLGSVISASTPGPGNIQTPAIVSGLFKDTINRMTNDPSRRYINDALVSTDPSLLDALLRSVRGKPPSRKDSRAVAAWVEAFDPGQMAEEVGETMAAPPPPAERAARMKPAAGLPRRESEEDPFSILDDVMTIDIRRGQGRSPQNMGDALRRRQ